MDAAVVPSVEAPVVPSVDAPVVLSVDPSVELAPSDADSVLDSAEGDTVVDGLASVLPSVDELESVALGAPLEASEELGEVSEVASVDNAPVVASVAPSVLDPVVIEAPSGEASGAASVPAPVVVSEGLSV